MAGRRRTLLGGEIHNSNASGREAIETSFRRVKDLGADCVLAPVAWDTFEPVEGAFDTTLVDHMVRTAVELRLDLIPLWFGSWKNGLSTYVPSWIKTDHRRFPRVATPRGSLEVLSPFAQSNRDADVQAFAALMRRLREQDTDGHVLLVQVENEVGLLGSARDHSAPADVAWSGLVPSPVVEAIRSVPGTRAHEAWREAGSRETGTWTEVLGDGPAAEEAFMADAFARYVDHVAAAGRHELDVPLFVNAWQDAELDVEGPREPTPSHSMAGGDGPGSYPSGGPVRDVIPIWRASAPNIDVCVPDIYARDFEGIAETYRQRSGALFIPEMQGNRKGVGQMFHAIGELGAFGVAPFGADSLGETAASAIRDGYRILRAVAFALAVDSDAETRGAVLTWDSRTVVRRMTDLELTIAGQGSYPAHAVIIREGDQRILVAGRGCLVSATGPEGEPLGILRAAELRQNEEGWTVVRVLNGDETTAGTAVRLPPLEPPEQVGPIQTWNESTGIVRIEYYRRG